MKKLIAILLTAVVAVASPVTSLADVVSSAEVIAQQQHLYSKQQLLDMVDSQAVAQKLESLGVSAEAAKSRIAQMTTEELNQFHNQLNELPAGGSVGGVILTILLVIALLDILGITDVYPFIEPL